MARTRDILSPQAFDTDNSMVRFDEYAVAARLVANGQDGRHLHVMRQAGDDGIALGSAARFEPDGLLAIVTPLWYGARTQRTQLILRAYGGNEAIGLFLESPCFGLTWDIGHSKAVAEKDVPFILSHQDRLVHFHIHDGTEQPPRNHLALGDGEIDLAARLGLAESRRCRCVLETKTVEALTRSVGWLAENR